MSDEVDAQVADYDSDHNSMDIDYDTSFPGKKSESPVHKSLPRCDEPLSTKSWSKQGKDVYKMNNQERGVALIINNKNFESNVRMKKRTGTDFDAFKVFDLLDDLGFEVIIQRNDCTVDNMKELMKKVSSYDFSNKDCFVCFILSYGEEGYVYGSDGRIQVDELFKPLKGDQCSSLAGKPKLFFIQACNPSAIEAHDGVEEIETPGVKQRIPVEADILIVHSQISGSYTWNANNQACIFIETLFEVVKSSWRQMDFLKMMTRMSKETAKKMSIYKIHSYMTKMPFFTSTLTKDLYFSNDK